MRWYLDNQDWVANVTSGAYREWVSSTHEPDPSPRRQRPGRLGAAARPGAAGRTAGLRPPARRSRRPEGLARLVRAERPQFIVNAGAYTAVDKAESDADNARLINARAVAVLAEAALRRLAGALPTDYVFDGAGSAPFAEDAPTGPLSVYGQTKLEGEQAIRASGCRHLIFRTSWVYARAAELRQDHAAPGRATRRTQGRGRPVRRADQRRADRRRHRPGPAASVLGCRAGSTGQRHHHLVASGETSWHLYARFVIEQALERGWELQATPQRVLPITTEDYPVPAKRPANRASTQAATGLGLVLPDWRYHAGRMIQELSEQGPL